MFPLKNWLVWALLTVPFFAAGQVGKPGVPPTQPKPIGPGDFIQIRFSDQFSYYIVAPDTLKKLVGHVELNQDTIFLFCDSALITNSIRVAANGNFILQHGDSISIFSDSAVYQSDVKIADLFVNVSLVKGRQKLFTDRLTYDANTKIATYLTGATLTDDTTFLTSVRGYFHAETDDIFFKDSVVVVNPDFTLRSDTLQFNASSRIVTFLAPTLIKQDSAKIYTEAGFYDIPKKLAEFTRNPQYLKNDQRAWAKVMRYDGNLEEVTLIGDAHFLDSTTFATADRIRYNEKTDVTVLEGNAYIKDDKREIRGDTVTYDGKNETYATRGRTHIVDKDQILDADRVDYDKERELGIAQGNVFWKDTTENMTVIAGYAEHSKKKNYLKASGGKTGRPLLVRLVDGDSLFVSADTLMSLQVKPGTQDTAQVVLDTLQKSDKQPVNDKKKPNLPPPASRPNPATDGTPQPLFDTNLPLRDTLLVKNDSLTVDSSLAQKPPKPNEDSIRMILAFHDVRIFKSDLQAVCDSLAYSSADSLFRLFTNPLIWSDTSQFSADTVNIQLANDKIDRIFMRENSFIINSPDEVFFNQIKGKYATAFFDSSELRRVRVDGNAESVYYALDDDQAYIGVNKTICSEMLIFFGDNKVEGIKFYTAPKANLMPMKSTDHQALKMPGFDWQIEKRPRSVADILTAKKLVAVPLSHPAEVPPNSPPILSEEFKNGER